ncbi:hypothetical protein NPIL_116571 [Nephila pilipes]|uniref:Uncharacterized protein n=1 Tax=Nephila pilipes TaxID=299642 RepID=A0A8X6K1P1_NEPPI|nr:hypothetical protein NPIL_116571 [Nephila pilipes]
MIVLHLLILLSSDCSRSDAIASCLQACRNSVDRSSVCNTLEINGPRFYSFDLGVVDTTVIETTVRKRPEVSLSPFSFGWNVSSAFGSPHSPLLSNVVSIDQDFNPIPHAEMLQLLPPPNHLLQPSCLFLQCWRQAGMPAQWAIQPRNRAIF